MSDRARRADVLVIGAGPAGSVAACALARQGLHVVLVDKHAFPRDKACGDALLPDALKALDRLELKPQVLAEAVLTSRLRIYAPDRTFVDLEGEFACLPRYLFDNLLREAAVAAGAQFASPYRLVAPVFDGGIVSGARVRNDRNKDEIVIRAKVTVVATGAAAGPLLLFGVCEHPRAFAVAARVYVTTDLEFARRFDCLCISYDRMLCPGYGWIFPGPDGVFNVGVGYFYDVPSRPLVSNLRTLLDVFLGHFPLAREVMERARSVTAPKGAPLRTAMRGATLSRPGLLIIGEAAGLTYSLSGEGIGKAMESGLIAADAIGEALGESPDAVLHAGKRYRERLVAEFSERFRAYEIAQRWIATPGVANFLAWRARRGAYVRRQLEGLLTETSDPRDLFSARGLILSLAR